MKNSKSIHYVNKEWNCLRKFDLREIDNEDEYDFFRLHYLERIGKIIEVAERSCPAKKILEVGSAQLNTSLLLAEKEFFYDRSRD